MDELDKLINDFKDKKVSHPNLSTLWIDYLMLRKRFLELNIILNKLN